VSTQWTMHGREFANCNCAWGCPCQFNSPSTYGFCEAVTGGQIDEGHHGDVRLDGLDWAMILKWPGEIAAGNGRQQFIIDERADPAQREALGRILRGEDTAAGATHFFVFNSTMSEVLETLYRPIELEIDVEARRARLSIPGLVESLGEPIIDPNSGEPFRARIDLPNGFEYSMAEVGTGRSRVTGELPLELDGTYGQFNEVHMNQDGVIR
jgi:hypothetical protein